MDFVASKKYEPLSTHALLVHRQFCLSTQSLGILGWPATPYVALELDQWAQWPSTGVLSYKSMPSATDSLAFFFKLDNVSCHTNWP